MGERRRRPEGVKLGRAAARGGTWERRRLRLHRLKRHAPVQFAVRPPQQLRRSTEMKVCVSRIADGPTAVISFESVYGLGSGLGLLRLGHVGHDNSCGEGGGPIREIRTDVLEILLYRSVARRLQCSGNATYWQGRSRLSAMPFARASRDGKGCARTSELVPARAIARLTECCCCK